MNRNLQAARAGSNFFGELECVGLGDDYVGQKKIDVVRMLIANGAGCLGASRIEHGPLGEQGNSRRELVARASTRFHLRDAVALANNTSAGLRPEPFDILLHPSFTYAGDDAVGLDVDDGRDA